MKPTVSIITVNLNDAEGLEKTIRSVIEQGNYCYEFIVIDGASTDGSVDVIEKYKTGIHKWISEPDTGIFNAMNKGIRMAEGDYCYFLNANDVFADKAVLASVFLGKSYDAPFICGHQLNDYGDHEGRVSAKNRPLTLSDFYWGTIKHQATFIRRDLFDKYGLYDESLKITADWKFFLETIGLHNEQPIFVDVDVVRFAWFGISTDQKYMTLHDVERKKVLSELIPESVRQDYEQMGELNNYRYIFELMKKNRIFRSLVKGFVKIFG